MTEKEETPDKATDSASSAPSQPTQGEAPRDPLRFALPLAIAGLGFSLLLEYVHLKTYLSPSADSFCTVGKALDCVSVAASPASVFLGLPWAIWGAVGYGAIVIATHLRARALLPLAGIAAMTSVGLLILSFVKIGALCYLCEIVHVISWVLFYVVWKGQGELKGRVADPSTLSTILAAPAGIAVALFFFIPHYWGAFSYKSEPPFATGVTEEGHPWIGAENPTETIEEFVDYRCPHCKIASTRTLRKLDKNPGWRVVRMQQPRMRCVKSVPSSCQSTRLAYCAQEQGKFWRADRWLFANQDVSKEPDPAQLAEDIGLDKDKLLQCYQAQETFERGNVEGKAARKSGYIHVPAYRVNGKRIKGEEVEKFFR